jgi:hypothetical protein
MGCLGCRFPWKFVHPPHHKFDNYSRTRITHTLGRVVTALIGAALAASVGCTSSKLNSTGPSGSKCQVTVSNADSTIAAGGGTTTVAIAAEPECAWTASTDANWITNLAPPSGQGNSAVQVSAAPNGDPVTRRGMVHIAATDVQITQAAAPCVFQVNPLSRDVGAAGGTTSVSITANGACGWTAASTVSWIRITAGASGSGNGTAAMAVDANAGPARQGVVTVAGQAVTINQSPLACSYSLSPTTGSIGAAGGAGPAISVTATASCSWTATSADNWITMVSGAGSGNGSVTYNVASNTGAARSGTIVIAGQTFTLNQAAAVQTTTCTYSINPTSQSFAVAGGSGTVAVTTTNGCAWTAVSNAAWITVTGGAAGSGNGTVNFRAAANTGAARSGTITIAGQTFTVSEALLCTYTINPTSKAFGLTGGTGTVEVTAPASCAWTAVSNAADWIKVTGGASGSGNGTVAYTAQSAGDGGKNRSGTVTIATETFTVSESKN